MTLPPEVLIYIQSVKNFLDNDSQAKEYFIHGGNEEFFFYHLTEIAQKNLESEGNAMLTMEQFELIRKTMVLIQTINKTDEQIIEESLFIDYKEYGKFCLN